MNIGIMGGTFNPIHLGHLILSEYILEELKLDKIIFIPTGHPPHKNRRDVLEGSHRKAMTELAISDNPKFSLSEIELRKESTAFTVDTISELKDIYKNDNFFMIIGADSLFDIETWKDPPGLLKQAEFIVADRVLREKKDLKEEIKRLNLKYSAKINFLTIPLIEVSSTDIRNRVNQGKSIKYLVKENVRRYILDNNLYK